MRLWRDQRGQALVEAILVGLILLVPLIWAVGVLSELHRAALASSAAVRDAGTDAARSSSESLARAAVDEDIHAAFSDARLNPSMAHITVSAPAGLQRGQPLTVSVAYPVHVFRVPMVGALPVPVVWVRATHVARVDPYRSR